jgi:hypothetical protein
MYAYCLPKQLFNYLFAYYVPKQLLNYLNASCLPDLLPAAACCLSEQLAPREFF